MSEYQDALDSLKTLLGEEDPAAHVTRSLREFELAESEQYLAQGLWAIVAGPIRDFSESPRVAEDGKQVIRLVWKQLLDPNTTGPALESAEFAALEVVRTVLRRGDLPRELQTAYLREFVTSSQIDHPLAWAAFELENWVTTDE